MDIVTLLFAVIICLLLTKYLPPHSTYLETVQSLKDEIKKILSKISDFAKDLTGLKKGISTEIEKAIDEIKKVKEKDSEGINEQVQKIISKIEAFDELQKIPSKLGGLDEKLQSLKSELENELKKLIGEIGKLSSSEANNEQVEEIKEVLLKISALENTFGNIKTEIATEIQRVSGEISQLKAQNDIVTTFIEEAKKSHMSEKFELYNGLWLSLIELKTIANELWEYPSREKAKKLAKQVLETKKMLEQSAIFIPESLFNKLMDIIQEFEGIQFGKISLVKLRNVSVKNKDFPENDLKAGLKNSKKIKDNYISVLEELKKYIKKHVVES